MARMLSIPTYADDRGELRVLQEIIPFKIERVYFIMGKPEFPRGGHRHKNTDQALISVHGSCIISNDDGEKKEEFLLDNPSKCLLVFRDDWHIMHSFSEGSVLLVLASTKYSQDDYIDDPYPDKEHSL